MPANLAIALRDEFPVTNQMLYLDSAHQTPMANCIRAALAEFLVEGNQMAGPKPVWLARVNTARQDVADLLNASPSEIAFTKNTSEGLNIAANAIPLQAGDEVLLITGDHPNNAYAWLNLRRKGVVIKFVEVADDAVADASTFAPYITPQTKVISLSHVTFHAGQRHDVRSVGQLCKEQGLYLVVDAMQSAGVLPIDVKLLGVSVLAAGCHKGLLVPQGLGILYVKADLQELQPPYLAMSSMANPPEDFIARPDDMKTRDDASRFEIGNLNLPDLHTLSTAVGLIQRAGCENIETHVLELGDHLLKKLGEIGVKVIGPRERAKRAHIYVLALPTTEWTDYLAKRNVRVSPERGGVRISFGVFNTMEDVNTVIDIIQAKLRAASGATI